MTRRPALAVLGLVFVLVPSCSDDGERGPAAAPSDVGPTSTASEPPPTTAAPGPSGWSVVRTEDAGLGSGASPDEITSDGDRALLVGASYAGGDAPTGAIWWSDDGRTWHEAAIPGTDGPVYAAAVYGDLALAAGRTGYGLEDDVVPFVWRSDDGGLTWSETDLPTDELGPSAPEMGRPFVSQVVRRDGWWVAAGGSSTGYAGVWISETGEAWEQVLESRESGGFSLVEVGDEGLMAWAGDQAWLTTDGPEDWSGPQTFDVPDRSYLMSVSADAAWAVWDEPDQPYNGGTILHSDDGGRTFVVDRRFATDHPGAGVTSVSRHGGLTVLAGYDRGGTPGAWLSTDGRTWEGIPRRLREPPGGQLALTAEVDGQVVVFGTAPEMSRFYVYRP